jgi:hypothetical protein
MIYVSKPPIKPRNELTKAQDYFKIFMGLPTTGGPAPVEKVKH